MWSLSLLWQLRTHREEGAVPHPHGARPAQTRGKGVLAGQAAHSGVLLLLLRDKTLDKLNLDFFFWSPLFLWRSSGGRG